MRAGGGGGSAAARLLAGEADGLALSFTSASALVKEGDATTFTGRPEDLVTATRASTATYFNAALLMETAAIDALRYDHDATSGALGLLVESAATNLCLWSQEMNSGRSWTGTNGTMTDNAVVAPDGTTTMEAFVEDATNAAHILSRLVGSISSGVTYCWSGFVKKAANRYAQFSLSGGGVTSGNSPQGIIDFDTGEFFPVNPTTISPDVTVRNCGGGIFRVSIVTLTTSTANLTPRFYGSADGTYAGRSYAGVASAVALYVWGGQVEVGVRPSSYLATNASTAARSADSITLATSEFPWSATEGTVYINARTPWATGASVLWQVDDGTEDNRFRIERDATNNLRFIVTTGGVEQANLDLGVVGHNADFQVTAAWAADDFAASLDGGVEVTDAGGTLPTVTTLRLGSSFTGEQWSSHIKTLAYVPRRVS